MHTVCLFPGMGADERQFAAQRAVIPSLRVPEWIEPRMREPLRDYAQRIAATTDITPESIVGGSSFGGMIALEIARIVGCRGVILIGSCCTGSAISPSARRAFRVVSPLPPRVLDWMRPLAPPLLPLVDPLGPSERALLIEMSRGTPMSFLKWAGRAACAWTGCAAADVKVRHIHGARDRCIPASRVNSDRVVPGAGHFLNLSHPDEVNRFVAESMEILAHDA